MNTIEEIIALHTARITDPISLDTFVNPTIITTCGHTFSREQIDNMISTYGQYVTSYPCPSCRTIFTKANLTQNFALADSIPIVQAHIAHLVSQIADNTDTNVCVNTNFDDQNEILENSHTIVKEDITRVYDPIDIQLKHIQYKTNQLIMIEPNGGSFENSSIIILCIDISSSIKGAVFRRGENGKYYDDGFCRLDIVKHAAISMIRGTNEQSMIGIVSFSDTAQFVCQPTKLTALGKVTLEDSIRRLQPCGSTNLWGGIILSLNELKNYQSPILNRSIILLTDGEPTKSYDPIGGYEKAIDIYIETNPNIICVLNAIGFGYDLNSLLLDKISRKFNGSYCFIPDGSMVGTIFTHICSNTAVRIGNNAELKIEFASQQDTAQCLNLEFGSIEDSHPTIVKPTTAIITLGSINIGQALYISFPKTSKLLNISLTYIDNQKGDTKSVILQCGVDITQNVDDEYSQDASNVRACVIRQLIVSYVKHAMKFSELHQFDKARRLISECIERVNIEIGFSRDIVCQEILKDLQGQITKAISRYDWYFKWGRHYLLSLIRAYSLHQCTNHKDPGIQMFGGVLAKSIRDVFDDMFLTLPPPVPSRNPSIASNYNTPRPIDLMRSYSTGPCFKADCLVAMANGSTKRVDDIRPGDNVKSSRRFCDFETSGYIVKYILKSKCHNNTATFVKYKDLYITPTHPIIIDSSDTPSGFEFKRPIDLEIEPIVQQCEYVYNFVLESGHVMNISDVECVTLGHGFTGNEIIEHPFYGTSLIVNTLYSMTKLDQCTVILESDCVIRDPVTSWVTGLNEKCISVYV